MHRVVVMLTFTNIPSLLSRRNGVSTYGTPYAERFLAWRGVSRMTATSAPISQYATAPDRLVSAANGLDYAYPEVGEGTPALALLQHFPGTSTSWDPALVDALVRGRRVVRSTTPGWGIDGHDAEHDRADGARCDRFFEALDVGEVDLLGFSIGSFVVRRSR